MNWTSQKLRELSTWTGVVGWVTVIAGGLSALAGLFAFVIGAIPGVVSLIMGLKLLEVKKHAEMLAFSPTPNDVDNLAMITDLTTYFKIQGVLIIIGVVLGIFGLLIGLAGMFAAVGSMM